MRDITQITLPLPFRMGSVNCYLIPTDNRFVLVDTGAPNASRELEKNLERFGCRPGDLHLILLTHGDFDHTGNAAYLSNTFNAKTAIHPDDAILVERGDMFLNRNKGNRFQSWLVGTMFGFGKSQRFTPALQISDGFDLSEFGLDARVIHLPGHSKGSIGILFSNGNLICGDLFENTKQPQFNTLMDNAATGKKSLEKLGDLEIATVYPGHGKPFSFDTITR